MYSFRKAKFFLDFTAISYGTQMDLASSVVPVSVGSRCILNSGKEGKLEALSRPLFAEIVSGSYLTRTVTPLVKMLDCTSTF